MFITASSLGCSSVPTATWTSFAAAFARVVSSDTSSMSTACAGANPSFAAATERTRAPHVLPALGHVVHRDDVETERRVLGVDGVRPVELLDALGEDVEQERELG